MCICDIVNLILTEFPKGKITSYLATLANWVFQTAAVACEGGIIFKSYE
jgi:energy-converting hydrogenase Eha subunit F